MLTKEISLTFPRLFRILLPLLFQSCMIIGWFHKKIITLKHQIKYLKSIKIDLDQQVFHDHDNLLLIPGFPWHEICVLSWIFLPHEGIHQVPAVQHLITTARERNFTLDKWFVMHIISSVSSFLFSFYQEEPPTVKSHWSQILPHTSS